MSKQSLTARTVNGAIWVFSGAGAQALLSLLVTIVLARLISPSEFGVVGAALIVVGFSQNFSKIGIGPAIVQRLELTDTHVHVGFTLSVILGSLTAVIIYAFAPVIAQFFRMPTLLSVIQVLAVLFPITAVSAVPEALMQRGMKFKSLSAIMVASYAFGYGFIGISLAYMGKGVWALVYAQLGQALVKTLILLVIRPKTIGMSLRKREAGQLLYFGSGFSFVNFVSYIAVQADNFVVGRWLGSDALGIYGRAYQIMMLPANLLGKVADTALFPAMASVQNEMERIGRSYIQAITIVVMLALPLSGVVIVLAPEIVLVVLGEEWKAAIIPLRILAIVTVFRTGYKISDTLARALGAIYQHSWRDCLYAGSVFCGALIGQFWGLVGVAVGTALAIVVNFLLMLHLSLQLTKVPLREIANIFWRHLLTTIIVMVGAMILKLVFGHFNAHAVVILVCEGIAVSILLAVVWLSLPKIFDKEIVWLGSMIRGYASKGFLINKISNLNNELKRKRKEMR